MQALVLARSQNYPQTMSRRVAGIVSSLTRVDLLQERYLIRLQVFLDTPHNDSLQIWMDTLNMTRDLRDRSSRDLRMAQTTKNAEDFVDLIRDFQQISSSYSIIYICNEDWLECSGATVRILIPDGESYYSIDTLCFRCYIPIAYGQWCRWSICDALLRKTTISIQEPLQRL